jgi:adenine-specific DNA-methyltransferase
VEQTKIGFAGTVMVIIVWGGGIFFLFFYTFVAILNLNNYIIDMDGKSLDITAERLNQLRAIFPEVFSEDKVDFQRLKQALGEDAFVQGEHYELSWAGKSEARKEVQKQTTATLIPDKENSIDFDNAQNIFIEGENLEVLRILQKSYFGKVKMIYIDPPYNTGNDSFVYPDDYTERQDAYKKRTGISNDEGFLNKQDLWKKNTKENGQFHSVWLSMMYPRLYLSRNLLREDGVIFISIDDNEVSNLKLMCDEVFGEENFITLICHKSRASVSNDKIISQNHNHILLYAKFQQNIFDSRMHFGLDPDLEGFDLLDKNGKYKLVPVSAPGNSKKGNPYFEFLDIWGYYRFSKDTMQLMYDKGLIVKNGETIQQKYYLEKAKQSRKTDTTWWDENFYTSTATSRLNNFLGGDFFTNPKPIELIKKMLKLINDKQALILDFFAGSGTTAQAVMELNEADGGNRQYICVQMPETTDEKSEAYKAGYKTIADITKARIQKVIEKIQARAAQNEEQLAQAISLHQKTKRDFDATAKATQLDIEGKLSLSKKEQALQEQLEKQAATIADLRQKKDIYSRLNLRCDSYMLAPSNFKQWRGDIVGKEAIAQQLDIFRHTEKEANKYDDMFTELCLKSGLGLHVAHSKEGGFYKTANAVWFCFEAFGDAMKQAILASKPQKVVFLNSCFDKDVDLSNFSLELKEHDINLSIL